VVFFIGPELAVLVVLAAPDFTLEGMLYLDLAEEFLDAEEQVVTPDIIGKRKRINRQENKWTERSLKVRKQVEQVTKGHIYFPIRMNLL
jgi:hypothetical protein